jgi:hypothetical protein
VDIQIQTVCRNSRIFQNCGFSLDLILIIIIKSHMFRSVGEYFADIVETLIPLGYIRYTILMTVLFPYTLAKLCAS